MSDTVVTFYKKESWGYSINRKTGDSKPRQYGAAIGDMSQFLDIDSSADTVYFTENLNTPEPRPSDRFPPHVRSVKYGFGKKK